MFYFGRSPSGDRLYFLMNDRSLGVLNGSLATVEKVRGSVMQVRLDDGRQVAFDTKTYGHIGLGYAATVHKAQGVTVDRAYVLASRHYDQHVAYVAMTRHRDGLQLFWSKEELGSSERMHRVMSRARPKDAALDWRQQQHEVEALAEKIRQAPPPAESPPAPVPTSKPDAARARRTERDARAPVEITRAEMQRLRDEVLRELADERKQAQELLLATRKRVVKLERGGPSNALDEAKVEYKKAKAAWEPHHKERVVEIAQERKLERDKDKGLALLRHVFYCGRDYKHLRHVNCRYVFGRDRDLGLGKPYGKGPLPRLTRCGMPRPLGMTQ